MATVATSMTSFKQLTNESGRFTTSTEAKRMSNHKSENIYNFNTKKSDQYISPKVSEKATPFRTTDEPKIVEEDPTVPQ